MYIYSVKDVAIFLLSNAMLKGKHTHTHTQTHTQLTVKLASHIANNTTVYCQLVITFHKLHLERYTSTYTRPLPTHNCSSIVRADFASIALSTVDNDSATVAGLFQFIQVGVPTGVRDVA